MNAIDLLQKQHREIEKLFSRFEKAKSTAEKESIFLDLAARLVGHDAIEREIFYPACERVLGKTEPLMEGIAEHGLIEFSVYRADRARGKDSFEYLVTVLKENVEHHVEEEEDEILPQAKKKMGSGMLETLGNAMMRRFEQAMASDFRPPLRRNLEQVLMGRAKTTPPPKRVARGTMSKRPARAATGRTKKSTTVRTKRSRASQR